MYGHLQVLSTIFCEEISISSLVGGERDLTLQCTDGIGLLSGVLGDLPGLVCCCCMYVAFVPWEVACESGIYNNLYYFVSVCCYLPVISVY